MIIPILMSTNNDENDTLECPKCHHKWKPDDKTPLWVLPVFLITMILFVVLLIWWLSFAVSHETFSEYTQGSTNSIVDFFSRLRK
jgi:hypothetical protein